MTRSRKGLAAALAGAALALGGTAAAAPASASSVRPMSSWLGTCYPWHDTHTAGGWCDGNGPNWTYSASAVCERGAQTFYQFGVGRWAGDRRGSYAYCSTDNATLVPGYGDLNIYYNGVYQFSVAAG